MILADTLKVTLLKDGVDISMYMILTVELSSIGLLSKGHSVLDTTGDA